jgi:uncharacterized RDD family membrane protein YckC
MTDAWQPDEKKDVKKEEIKEAGMLNRAVARVIDLVIIVALYKIIPAIGFFAGFVYLLIADGLFDGRSVGKKLLGLRVLVKHESGDELPCGIRESIYRNSPFALGFLLYGLFVNIPLIGWLLAFVIAVGVLIFEGLVMFGSEDGTRLGDELAKTHVVEQEREE